jgi:hypothetical protein
VVNNVLASCHSSVAVQTLQQTFFDWYKWLQSSFSAVVGDRTISSSKQKQAGTNCQQQQNQMMEEFAGENTCSSSSSSRFPPPSKMVLFLEEEDDDDQTGGGDLPLGVGYLLTVLELFVPKAVFL